MELKVTRFEVRDDGVATLWLDRPGRGNSWTNRMNTEYRYLMAGFDADPAVRVVVVTGAGRQFCVGADTKALGFYTESEEEYLSTVDRPGNLEPGHGVRPEFDHDLVWHWGLRVPVIAAVNGACAGIAVALAGFCDLRYAAAGAKFTTATPRLGLPAEYGLAWLLPRMVGVTHAADILFTGRVVRAEEMKEMGFLNDVVPAEEVLERAYAVAQDIARGVSPASVTVAKRQLYAELLRHDVGAAVDDSKLLIGEYMQRPDFREGVKAMAERRPPVFPPPSSDDLPPGPPVAPWRG
ncbi:MAG: enoyl-CoA hydratase [Pseudonocardia sp. SCN 72-86]|nr:MAG: enoyl-CoA hydratase [Pseudonocardia sp. SCN 72-86]